eukprot:TRINITY_DN7904_c0_g1_i1.p1 TRINITY_DN7904_c0_g1~~TRINITY_DN7904_c0_g1_i1.p1  ORF type:complete len:320 (-),score=92.83 TRINITY_DN7904_c0_g1_i1:13-972(-)
MILEALIALGGTTILILGFLHTRSQVVRRFWLPQERVFSDPNRNDSVEKFPLLSDPATIYLSVIVPAYNEHARLGKLMMEPTLDHLKKRAQKDPNFTYEIIVVDDGSRDDTSNIGKSFSKLESTKNVRVLTLLENRGKGGAVLRGAICARGRYILFADADGATDIKDLDRVEQGLKKAEKNGLGIAIGSRAHLQDDAVAERTFFRNLLMYIFHILVYVLCVKDIRDTQCGFKMFTREAALRIFPQLHIERWAFDVEILYIARNIIGIPITEVAVNWQEIPGSTISPMMAGFQMARDLLRIRLAYLSGYWKINSKINLEY